MTKQKKKIYVLCHVAFYYSYITSETKSVDDKSLKDDSLTKFFRGTKVKIDNFIETLNIFNPN